MKEYYNETDLQKGKLDLLSNTCMVDFAMDVHKSLYPDQEVPPTLVDKRASVCANKWLIEHRVFDILKRYLLILLLLCRWWSSSSSYRRTRTRF